MPASGNVTYYRYSGPNCTGVKTELGTVFVGSDGSVPNSPFTTFPNPGTYYYSASYTGDAGNNPDNSACEVLTVMGSVSSVSSSSTSTTAGSSLFSNPLILVGIIVIVVGLLGSLFFLRGRGASSNGGKKKPPPPPLTGGPPPPPPPPPASPPEVETCCGPDVTENVLGSMLKLMNDFFSWTREEQTKQIGYLTRLPRPFSYEPNFENAWDINELAPSEPRGGPPVSYATAGSGYKATLRPYVGRCMKPNPPCDPSVIFLGNCHHPQVVNYLEWGILARLGTWLDGSSATSYQDSSYYTMHSMRSGPLPAPPNTMPSPEAYNPPTRYSDPNFPDQVAMSAVGWRMAEDYIVRKNNGSLPYRLAQVNRLALQAILQGLQNNGRSMAGCKAGCGPLQYDYAFHYIFGTAEDYTMVPLSKL